MQLGDIGTAVGNSPTRPFQFFMRWGGIRKRYSLYIGGAMVALVLLSALFAPFLSPYSPIAQNYNVILQGISMAHWLGTDNLGRDTFTRLLYGARTSMEVTFGSVLLGVVIGVPLGLLSGYYQGWLDDLVLMRIIDALQAFPFLILALVLAAMLGPGIRNAAIAIGIGYIPIFVRTVRGQVLLEKNKEYIESARLTGCRASRLMLHHLLPNVMTPLFVQMTLAIANGIVTEASLGYLGLSAQPPTASWGSMLQVAQGYISTDPLMAIAPGIAIVFAVMGFNLLGDGLQTYFNKRKG